MLAAAAAALARPRDHLAHLGAPGLDRRELLEGRVGVRGEHPRKRRLPRPRRPVEDHRVRLAGLDRGPQRRATARAGARWPTNCSSVRGRMRAASGSVGGRAGGGRAARPGTSNSRPIARSIGRCGRRSLRRLRASGGGSARSGFGGPPAHVALLRDLTVERRRWIERARVRGRDRRLQPAARAGVDADGDLLRPARRGPRRRAGRRRWPSSCRGCSIVLRDRRRRAVRRAARLAFARVGAGAAARGRRRRSSRPALGADRDPQLPRRAAYVARGACSAPPLTGAVRRARCLLARRRSAELGWRRARRAVATARLAGARVAWRSRSARSPTAAAT